MLQWRQPARLVVVWSLGVGQGNQWVGWPVGVDARVGRSAAVGGRVGASVGRCVDRRVGG